MIRVFVDANVLFSAAYSELSALSAFWGMNNLHLVASDYVLDEARRNLVKKRPQALARFEKLLASVEITQESLEAEEVEINAKDRPVLEAALGAKCHYLITGNTADFAHLMDAPIQGMRVMMPVDVLKLIVDSEK